MELKKGSKIAIVCRGGPANGPFSAQALDTFRKGLQMNGYDISGIYAVSGSCPTALLGCVNEEEKLCNVWLNLTPEDIVGNLRMESEPSYGRFSYKAKLKARNFSRKARILYNIRKYGHAFPNTFLLKLIKKYCLPELERIFGSESILMKMGAVDYLTAQNIIFSNKIPEHRDLLCVGAIGSMCLIPWFSSPTIDNPGELKLTDSVHPEFNSLLLIDGAYRAGLLLEEAIRESIGYDAIFIIDIHGLEFDRIDPRTPYNAATRIQRAMSILATTNDQLLLSMVERINEELEIRDKLVELSKSSDHPEGINDLIKQMDNGRLHLIDKHAPKVMIISNPKYAFPFDFTKFGLAEVAYLMRAGHNTALRTLNQIGADTKGIPLIKP